MYAFEPPVFSKLQAIGKNINAKVKPKAVVVFSAHWQASSHKQIEVNYKENTSSIYEEVESSDQRLRH